MMQCSELGNGGGGLDSWRTVSEVSFTGWEFTEMMGHQSAIYRTITLYKPQAPEPAQQPELESSAEEEEEQEEEEDGNQNEELQQFLEGDGDISKVSASPWERPLRQNTILLDRDMDMADQNPDSGLLVEPTALQELQHDEIRRRDSEAAFRISQMSLDLSAENKENIPPPRSPVNDLECSLTPTTTPPPIGDDDDTMIPYFEESWELTASDEEIGLTEEEENSLRDCHNQIHYFTEKKFLIRRKKEQLRQRQQGDEPPPDSPKYVIVETPPTTPLSSTSAAAVDPATTTPEQQSSEACCRRYPATPRAPRKRRRLDGDMKVNCDSGARMVVEQSGRQVIVIDDDDENAPVAATSKA